MTTLTRVLLTAGALLVMAGCRNTTSTPVSPLGGSSLLSPLSPVQGTATLSPIQPTSGIGTFGAPTRVPPPPTGSYRSPGNYGAPSTYGAPTGNYAPSGSVPNGSSPSGATLGSNGMTRGLTDLSAPGAYTGGTGFDSGVRQTGWIGDASPGNSGFGNGVDPRLSPANQTTPAVDPAASPRAGGMQVIDLTHAPYPPGYVPPQNRSGAGAFPTSAPYPQTAPQTPSTPFQNSQPGFGQPTNSTFARTANGFSDATHFGDHSNVQTAGRPNSAPLPSTEPFPTTSNSGDSDLQWRRPSPRF
ncbi:hypothetical protein NZK35_17225 [Stieleria sp. ICT_E10.1]|uniref:hypothetical protein n=1 Tax=Stieleria sedimenti TaxID=2976331 RepID=UPI00217F8FE4|nr:hypothetical protein [Stieleria sedimenti]MCS7468397.1 hypothetical protein [Stieleria sedimenti]